MRDVGATAQQVLAVFTPVFFKALGVAMVAVEAEQDRIRRRERRAGDVEWRLLRPPIPSEPLKCGWMTKMGESVSHKSWRRRCVQRCKAWVLRCLACVVRRRPLRRCDCMRRHIAAIHATCVRRGNVCERDAAVSRGCAVPPLSMTVASTPLHRVRRYFVATNRAAGFALYYFEREDQVGMPSKRKGEVHLSGYSVRSQKREEDIRTMGENVLVLEVGALP